MKIINTLEEFNLSNKEFKELGYRDYGSYFSMFQLSNEFIIKYSNTIIGKYSSLFRNLLMYQADIDEMIVNYFCNNQQLIEYKDYNWFKHKNNIELIFEWLFYNKTFVPSENLTKNYNLKQHQINIVKVLGVHYERHEMEYLYPETIEFLNGEFKDFLKVAML